MPIVLKCVAYNREIVSVTEKNKAIADNDLISYVHGRTSVGMMRDNNSPNSIWLVTSRLDTTRSLCRASLDERVEPCCSNMADDEQAIARLYKFSRFYALTYANPICFVK